MIWSAIIGSVLLLIGIILVIADRSARRNCTITTQAVIVGTKQKTIRDEGVEQVFYHPIIKYTARGKTYKKKAHISSSYSNKFRKGDTVEIKYDPKKPDVFIIGNRSRLLFPGVSSLVFGVLFFVLFIIMVSSGV